MVLFGLGEIDLYRHSQFDTVPADIIILLWRNTSKSNNFRWHESHVPNTLPVIRAHALLLWDKNLRVTHKHVQHRKIHTYFACCRERTLSSEDVHWAHIKCPTRVFSCLRVNSYDSHVFGQIHQTPLLRHYANLRMFWVCFFFVFVGTATVRQHNFDLPIT